jgi:putative PIN family toxin of toxin-antitoxin system
VIRVVFDTNTIISALLFGGTPRNAFTRAIEGKIQNYASEEILTELEGVLSRSKFRMTHEQVRHIVQEFEAISTIVAPDEPIKHICRDRDDHIILECAVKSKADYIISGDKDLLVLGEYLGTRIVDSQIFMHIH